MSTTNDLWYPFETEEKYREYAEVTRRRLTFEVFIPVDADSGTVAEILGGLQRACKREDAVVFSMQLDSQPYDWALPYYDEEERG